jgi:hypothetical protein
MRAGCDPPDRPPHLGLGLLDRRLEQLPGRRVVGEPHGDHVLCPEPAVHLLAVDVVELLAHRHARRRSLLGGDAELAQHGLEGLAPGPDVGEGGL